MSSTPTLVFAVQLLPLVVQIFLGQVLDVQEALHYLIHSAVYERQSQVTERVVGQALLEGAERGHTQPSFITNMVHAAKCETTQRF